MQFTWDCRCLRWIHIKICYILIHCTSNQDTILVEQTTKCLSHNTYSCLLANPHYLMDRLKGKKNEPPTVLKTKNITGFQKFLLRPFPEALLMKHKPDCYNLQSSSKGFTQFLHQDQWGSYDDWWKVLLEVTWTRSNSLFLQFYNSPNPASTTRHAIELLHFQPRLYSSLIPCSHATLACSSLLVSSGWEILRGIGLGTGLKSSSGMHPSLRYGFGGSAGGGSCWWRW